MKFIAAVLGAMLASISAQAASVEGDITLPFTLSKTAASAVIKPFGDAVKATYSCYAGEFCGWETVFAQLSVTNTGSKPMWGQCCVGFYDRDRKLVGTVTQRFVARRGLLPGKSRTLPLCRTVLAKDKYRDIVSYQAVVYATDKPPLKTKDSILLEDP
jgi:hypothetical protein